MFHHTRRLRQTLVLAVGTASLAAAGIALVAVPPAHAAATGGSGASLPYVEVQAENSATNGTVIGPNYTQGQLADEASGRKAVTLQGQGKYVTFTTPTATNSIDFRYSIPDSSDGSVYTAPLSLYINGAKQTDFTVTNAYSWYYGSYPFVNTPGSGNPHHFYDEVHRLFSSTYPAGTQFTLQVDSEDTAPEYTIDFADFEQVAAALSQPAGSVSVTSEGADPTGVNDSTNAFNAAIAAAGSGGTVWIPPGSYNIPGHIMVNNVTVAGAGMWYSTVTGTAPGFYGNSAPTPSANVHLQNFAIFGNVQERCDSCAVNGIGGAMSNSTVSNIWIEHDKVGAWMDGPFTNLTFSGMRIRDTTADGINFHGGVTNSTVTNSDIRNTGDDGLATWADSSVGADSGDTFSNNTVQLQQLANGIAIYGGNNNTVTGNLVVDTGITQGGGIQVGQRFTSTPLGLTTISNNTMIRDGDLDPNWQFGVGALWFDGNQGWGGGPVNVSNALIEQSPFEAIQWVEGSISGVNLNNVTISGTGTFALQEQTPGTASATNVVATGVAQANAGNAPSYSCEGTGFTITDGGGNSGISPTQCNGWPAPVYPPYPGSGGGGSGTLTASPGSLSFGSQAVGSTSAAQSVTVTNTGSNAASVSSVSTTGPFSQTNNCGGSIAAGGSCTVQVKFAPTSGGSVTGTLSVASSAPGGSLTVALTGTGVTSTTNLALNQPVTASSSTSSSYTPQMAVDGNTSSYWESSDGAGYPQWITVDLGSVQSIGSITLDLPPSSAWATRTETLSVLGSTNNSTFTTIVGSAGYTFNPATGNTVTISLPSGNSARYVQLNFTANTGWSAAQLSEFEIFPGGSTNGGGALSASPSSVSFGSVTVGQTSAAHTVTVSNTGTSSVSISQVSVSGAFTQTNNCGSTLGAGGSCAVSVSFAPTGAGAASGTLTVASSAPGSPVSVLLSGTGVSANANLALNQPVTASGYTQTYVPGNAVDGNTSSYWESTDNAFPQWLQVDLGSAVSVGRIVMDLPPSSAWGTRTQTITIQGSTDGTNYTTLLPSTGYTFNSPTNTVTVAFSPATVRYLKLTFTANTGWPAGQLSELQVYAS